MPGVVPEGDRGAVVPHRGKLDNLSGKFVNKTRILTIQKYTFFKTFLIVKNTSFLDKFPRRIVNFPRLLISKALFIDLARQINKFLYIYYIDLKINAVACQLLRLFASENDGDAILGLQIMKFSQGSMPPDRV